LLVTDAEVLAAMVFRGWAWNEPKFEKVGHGALSMQEARELLAAQPGPPTSSTEASDAGPRPPGSGPM
jgi:hypothetical protein